MPVGIVLRCEPGATRWAATAWRAVGLLPGAAPVDARTGGRVLRRDGETAEIHAATLTLSLWRTDAEAYRVALSARVPSLFVVSRRGARPADPPRPALVTASPYEAQDYADSGEEIVEPVAMTPGLAAWIRDYCDEHHETEVFHKRRRDREPVDLVQDGVGDPRVRQPADVYRAPGAQGSACRAPGARGGAA